MFLLTKSRPLTFTQISKEPKDGKILLEGTFRKVINVAFCCSYWIFLKVS